MLETPGRRGVGRVLKVLFPRGRISCTSLPKFCRKGQIGRKIPASRRSPLSRIRREKPPSSKDKATGFGKGGARAGTHRTGEINLVPVLYLGTRGRGCSASLEVGQCSGPSVRRGTIAAVRSRAEHRNERTRQGPVLRRTAIWGKSPVSHLYHAVGRSPALPAFTQNAQISYFPSLWDRPC